MTTYYVGSGGNDSNAGTSWALRKLTLNGAEDKPVAAGDTVYVGPGTYRETLTVDVSGSSGSPITYIGDYTGANTDGVGGVVRISGSDDDITETRATCITATSKNYRTFKGFTFDLATGNCVSLATSCSNWIIEKCYVGPQSTNGITIGGSGTANTVRNCYFIARSLGGYACLTFSHSATVSNAGHVVESCIFMGGTNAVLFTRVGGVTIRNCLALLADRAFRVATALAAGQTITVNNCIIGLCGEFGMQVTAAGEMTEDYNAFFANGTNRAASVDAGAHSNLYPPLLDTRWFFKMVGA